MKAQVYFSDHAGAQHAIDKVKAAYSTGKPHVLIIQEPAPQTTSKQKQKAMTVISMIARETGETDVERLKRYFIEEWFEPETVEVMGKEVEVFPGLRQMSKEELSFFIDQLEQFAAEQGYRV